MKKLKQTEPQKLDISLKGMRYNGMIHPFREMTWKIPLPPKCRAIYIKGWQIGRQEVRYTYILEVEDTPNP